MLCIINQKSAGYWPATYLALYCKNNISDRRGHIPQKLTFFLLHSFALRHVDLGRFRIFTRINALMSALHHGKEHSRVGYSYLPLSLHTYTAPVLLEHVHFFFCIFGHCVLFGVHCGWGCCFVLCPITMSFLFLALPFPFVFSLVLTRFPCCI